MVRLDARGILAGGVGDTRVAVSTIGVMGIDVRLLVEK